MCVCVWVCVVRAWVRACVRACARGQNNSNRPIDSKREIGSTPTAPPTKFNYNHSTDLTLTNSSNVNSAIKGPRTANQYPTAPHYTHTHTHTRHNHVTRLHPSPAQPKSICSASPPYRNTTPTWLPAPDGETRRQVMGDQWRGDGLSCSSCSRSPPVPS